MKILHALLIILLISLYNAADLCSTKEDPTKASDCTGLEVDKEKGYVKCCYEKKDISFREVCKQIIPNVFLKNK